jgi:hypothetical protein
MNWSKVVYVFFALMSVTTTAGFLYEQYEMALFIAMSVNLISTWLKIGINNLLASELLASSFVADLHLVPAFLLLTLSNNVMMASALVIGALIANVFSLALILIEASKANHEEDEY